MIFDITIFEILRVPQKSKTLISTTLTNRVVMKILVANPGDFAVKSPEGSGPWGSWLGLGLAGTLWAAIGSELKKVEGPEFPPWGAGPTPVTLLPSEGEYSQFIDILLVSLVVLGVSTENRAASCPLGVVMGARRDGALDAAALSIMSSVGLSVRFVACCWCRNGTLEATACATRNMMLAGLWGAVSVAVTPSPLARTSIELPRFDNWGETSRTRALSPSLPNG